MKILLAILSCHKYRPRADAQRSTWVKLVNGPAVRFFLGSGGQRERPDEVLLDVADDYHSLPYKKRAMCQWAIEQEFDYVCKLDDDVYVQPDRLLASDFTHDYVGTFSLGKPVPPYFSGFAHWLSRRSMEVLAKAEIDDWAEDRWTGKTLHTAGVVPREEDRYVIINSLNKLNPVTGTVGPRWDNDVIAAAEFEPGMMHQLHVDWNNPRLFVDHILGEQRCGHAVPHAS